MPTRQILLASLLMAMSIYASGADNLVVLDEPVDAMCYHLRLEAPRSRSEEASLIWNYTDSANYTALSFTLTPRVQADPHTGFDSRYKLYRKSASTDSVLAEGVFTTHYPTGTKPAISVVLTIEGARSFASIGGKHADLSLRVPFDALTPGAIGYRCTAPLAELRNDIRLLPKAAPERAPFTSLDSIKAHIAASADPMECFWRYLDRDTDPERASLGGIYTLATVAEPGGSYAIVYISGASAGTWKPLMIKGRLTPSIFRNHYDLEWRDASGRSTATETSATIELDGNIMRLNFPLSKAIIRFSRVEAK